MTTNFIGTVTCTTVANHIFTVVSELPDYLSRHMSVSGVVHANRGGSQNVPGPHHRIYNADDSIHTGHHPSWMTTMDATGKKEVNDERVRWRLGRHKKKVDFQSPANKSTTTRLPS